MLEILNKLMQIVLKVEFAQYCFQCVLVVPIANHGVSGCWCHHVPLQQELTGAVISGQNSLSDVYSLRVVC